MNTLYLLKIKSFEQLAKELDKAVKSYNEYRPHWEIKALTPCQFESNLKTLPKCQRTILNIFVEQKTIIFQQSLLAQLSLF